MLDNPPGAAPFLSVNAIKTELVRRGQGSPLLFIHSELGPARDGPVVDRLAAKFDVVAPSLPGYGRTDMPRSYSTADDLAYFTLDVIEMLDLRDLVLVGVSFGGWVAAEIATKTERVKRLVLANPVGIKTGGPTHRDMADVFALPQKELEAATFHDPSHARFDPVAATEEEVYIRLRNRESTVLFGWSPYMYNPKLLGRLHRIRVPTLVLWGASDRIASPDYGRAFVRAIPGARFETIERAGRFAHIEQPGDFANRIAAFAA